MKKWSDIPKSARPLRIYELKLFRLWMETAGTRSIIRSFVKEVGWTSGHTIVRESQSSILRMWMWRLVLEM